MKNNLKQTILAGLVHILLAGCSAPSSCTDRQSGIALTIEQVKTGLSKLDLQADPANGEPPLAATIRRLARRLLNLPRNLSLHPGGLVITPRPIEHYAPIQEASKRIPSRLEPEEASKRLVSGLEPEGPVKRGGLNPASQEVSRPVRVTQYDKDGAEMAGLVKLDLLGNRNLSTVRYAVELLRQREVAIDIEALPPDDPATVRTLQSADTVGCNQLESPAMRHLLRMLRPAGVRDVMKALALIRPGAASIGMKEVFIRRHRGLEAPPRGHPLVDAILAETHGVMLYEDDVMLVAAALTGSGSSSLLEADRFRRAIQRCRDDDARRALSREFLARCRANGVDERFAKSIWVQMAKFNAYSFCRAHAASYAALAYAGAYLKTHYPLEFWTAALNNNQSMYHLRVYVEQAKRAGIRFLLPDANRSGAEFQIEGRAIRVGLGVLAELGPASVEAILTARRTGPFAGLSDFLRRTNLGSREARALVQCGAFDFTGRIRPALMMELELFFARRPGPSLPGPSLLPAEANIPPGLEDYSEARKYADERRIMGFSVREHIMARYRPGLNGAVDIDSRLLGQRVGRRVRIAGVLEASRTVTTRSGRQMRFLTLEDEYGMFEVTIFPDAARRWRRGSDRRRGRGRAPARFDHYGPYLVAGTVEDWWPGRWKISTTR